MQRLWVLSYLNLHRLYGRMKSGNSYNWLDVRGHICLILRRNSLNVGEKSSGGHRLLMKLINYTNVISCELYCGFSVLSLSIIYHDDHVHVLLANLNFFCRHAQDVREHYERKLERANNLYMELTACMLQLEKRERELLKWVGGIVEYSYSRCFLLAFKTGFNLLWFKTRCLSCN